LTRRKIILATKNSKDHFLAAAAAAKAVKAVVPYMVRF
jgi:hypothetical protein